MNLRAREVLNTDIYGITAERYSRGRSSCEVVAEMIAAGIKVIQYREKVKTAAERYRDCLQIREMTSKAGVALIIDDFVDLAMMVGADGVHLGQEDLPPEAVRKLVGEEMIIGLSTHSPAQAQAAEQSGVVDYIGVGPIFPTHTKENVCAPVGLTYLDFVVHHIKLPFVAIGGIKEHNIAQVAAAGAGCIAMVTEIVGAEDIGQKVSSLRAVLKKVHLTGC